MTTDTYEQLIHTLPDTPAGDALALYLHGLDVPRETLVTPPEIIEWLDTLRTQIDAGASRLPAAPAS